MSALVPWTVITRALVGSGLVITPVRSHKWLGPIDDNIAFKAAKIKFNLNGEIVDAIVKGSHHVVTDPAHVNKTQTYV